MHRFHDACILRLACAGQDMREYFFLMSLIFFDGKLNFFLMTFIFFLIADSY